jgi:four helix bundle protein
MHKYEDLHVYQKAVDLAAQVYEATATWPVDERFGLTSQLRRAATSIVLNIAEGAGAGSEAEFIRFLRFSLRSKYELMAGFDIAVRVGLASSNDTVGIRKAADEIAAMIVGLIRSLDRATTDY